MNMDVMDLFAVASVVSAAQETGLLRALHSGSKTALAYKEAFGGPAVPPGAIGALLARR
ncbi:hypothetical protein [Chondromyces apiculatus]|uniref:Uncharacterized protein n=1 Tax=Chondromyces apiculatus DSM 436 TaxID=1192034 RepID=A0A017TF75_9BACT|nr:hypothetical protein [Chondromyces apiculatus]EYF07266.1 Hypothetical protein CAP_0745 [Chondromyces apiculatus DSM 436]